MNQKFHFLEIVKPRDLIYHGKQATGSSGVEDGAETVTLALSSGGCKWGTCRTKLVHFFIWSEYRNENDQNWGFGGFWFTKAQDRLLRILYRIYHFKSRA